jgi:hypothetical protein
MKLLCASVLIVSLASLAVAEDQTKAVDLGKIPIKTVTVKVDAGSGLATISSATTREVFAKDVTIAANNHGFVNRNEVVLLQNDQKVVIPVKTITGVSYTAVNMVAISVSASPLTEASSPPELVKTKDHYIGIVWKDQSETSGVVLKVAIGEYWGFMTALESVGIKAVNADVVGIVR